MPAVNPLHAQKPLDFQENKRKHSNPVLESHLVLLRTCEFSDVTFIVGESKERIQCHKLFLQARSPVFKVMFSERWNQGRKDIPLEDDDPKIFRKFLEFIYTDNFMATVSEALELLQIAHRYDVQLLVSKCAQVLMGNQVLLDDAVDVFQVARKYDMIQLMDKMGNLMAKSLSRLQFLPSISRMDKLTLMYVLQRNDLKMREIDLFHLAVKWAKNQSGSVVERSLMEDILQLIRFPLMSLLEFIIVVVPSGLLSQCAANEVFTYFGTDSETRKALAGTIQFSTQQRAFDNVKNRVCVQFVSIALYSADFVNCRRRKQKNVVLKEHLEFDIGEIVVACDAMKKSVVLSSVRIYCPTTMARINSGMTSPLTKLFDLTVTSYNPDTRNHFKIHCEHSNVETEEGNMMEVKLECDVLLTSGRRYSIVDSERGLYYESEEGQTYETRDFGCIQEKITSTIGEKCVSFQNFRRNSLRSFGNNTPEPRLIYELGLEEC